MMVITTKQDLLGLILIIDNNKREQVNSFRYLEALVNSKAESNPEIKSRIEKARRTFINLRNLFISRNISLQLKVAKVLRTVRIIISL